MATYISSHLSPRTYAVAKAERATLELHVDGERFESLSFYFPEGTPAANVEAVAQVINAAIEAARLSKAEAA